MRWGTALTKQHIIVDASIQSNPKRSYLQYDVSQNLRVVDPFYLVITYEALF